MYNGSHERKANKRILMGAFIAIVIGVVAGVFFCMLYVSRRTATLPFIQKLSGGRRHLAVLIAFLFYLAICVILTRWMNLVNTLICILHFGGFLLLSEFIFYLVRKRTHKQISSSLPVVIAIIFTICYMIAAWYLCTKVRETDYELESSRLKGDLRIVQIADSHVGTTFDAEGLKNYVHRINELHPDIVFVTGDFVDDDTSREDMTGSCEALGELDTKYGVFFSYGNHDKGYYRDEAKGWNNNDLLENLQSNGVTVLQDETELIDDRFYVVGRQDKSEADRGGTRMSPSELMSGLDPDLYKIVLDHQPCEYDEEAEAGADLVLSGHTHGGQFFPFNRIGVLTHQYERSYGYERRGDTDFIVTSGISDWSLIFKTGCQSEYVVIDVHGAG